MWQLFVPCVTYQHLRIVATACSEVSRWPRFNSALTVFLCHGMWPLFERHSKTVPLALRFVVLCLLQVHSADVKQHGLCAWVRVSKTPLNVIQSILVVAERFIESTVP